MLKLSGLPLLVCGMVLSFEHLTPEQFEEFSYDLLNAIGFTNVVWRKGAGRGITAADSGRDLEAQLLKKDIDNSTYVERWFVECKHVKEAVSPKPVTIC